MWEVDLTTLGLKGNAQSHIIGGIAVAEYSSVQFSQSVRFLFSNPDDKRPATRHAPALNSDDADHYKGRCRRCKAPRHAN